jgi:hypothetical protein
MRSKSEVVGTLPSVTQFLETIKNQVPVFAWYLTMEGTQDGRPL